jgi:hypothetical protein
VSDKEEGVSDKAWRGDLVQIHVVVLRPEERTASIPDCTKAVPYEAWVKGFLVDESARIGDPVRIRTFAERELRGELAAIEPAYGHGFGKPPVELIRASLEGRDRLGGAR